MPRALFPVLLFLALPLLTGCAAYQWYYEPSILQIRTDLPLGTSFHKVDLYLSEHQIDHTYLRSTNQIETIVKNVRRDALVQAEVSLVFQFDPNERLTDIREKPAYTAP